MTQVLVRDGADCKLKDNRMMPVYCEMFLQICRDYSSLPDVKTLTLSEISFYYDGLRRELKASTKKKV